jgi:hypothetical protein
MHMLYNKDYIIRQQSPPPSGISIDNFSSTYEIVIPLFQNVLLG